MATTHGNTGAVYEGANAVAEVTAWSYSENTELAPDTAMGDTAVSYVASGIKDGSGSVTCHWDPSDTNGQEALDVGSTVTLNVYPEGNSSTDVYYGGSVIINSIERSGDLNGIVQVVFSFQGVLTQATV